MSFLIHHMNFQLILRKNFIFRGAKKQEVVVTEGQMLGDLGRHEAVHSTLATSSPPRVNPLSKQLRKLQGKEREKKKPFLQVGQSLCE